MRTTEALSVREAACRVAAFGLAGVPRREPFGLPEGDWSSLLEMLAFERISGLAVAAWEGGELLLTERQAGELLALHRDDMAWVLELERTLLDLAGAFEDRGVELVVLKGPTLAHTVYPDPSWRVYGDIDLMVRTRDWRLSVALLRELGYRRRLPEPRPGFDERFGKAATHVGPNGLEVDLHRTLVLGPFGLWMDPEELMNRTETFTLGGRSLRGLDATGRFVNACVHAALGRQKPLLHMVRDVAQTADADVEAEVVADWADRWHLAPVVHEALAAASSTLGRGWNLPVRGATPVERRALEAYTTERRGRAGTAVATLRAIRGLRGKAGYVRALALPEKRFMRERTPNGGTALLGRWRKGSGWLTGRKR